MSCTGSHSGEWESGICIWGHIA